MGPRSKKCTESTKNGANFPRYGAECEKNTGENDIYKSKDVRDGSKEQDTKPQGATQSNNMPRHATTQLVQIKESKL